MQQKSIDWRVPRGFSRGIAARAPAHGYDPRREGGGRGVRAGKRARAGATPAREAKNAGCGVGAAGIARKWEGERRPSRKVHLEPTGPSGPPAGSASSQAPTGCVCLTKRMYD